MSDNPIATMPGLKLERRVHRGDPSFANDLSPLTRLIDRHRQASSACSARRAVTTGTLFSHHPSEQVERGGPFSGVETFERGEFSPLIFRATPGALRPVINCPH